MSRVCVLCIGIEIYLSEPLLGVLDTISDFSPKIKHFTGGRNL